MLHCLANESLPLIPHTGATVQAGHRLGRHSVREPMAEHIGKQVVVTIPLALIVERHDEEVGALQVRKDEG